MGATVPVRTWLSTSVKPELYVLRMVMVSLCGDPVSQACWSYQCSASLSRDLASERFAVAFSLRVSESQFPSGGGSGSEMKGEVLFEISAGCGARLWA